MRRLTARGRAAGALALAALIAAGLGVWAGASATRTQPSPDTRTGAPPGSAGGGGGLTTAGPAAAPPPAGLRFGANVNRLFEGDAFPGAALDAQLSALRATGATIARSDALWEAAEPTPPVGGVHHYTWGFADTTAAALARHGLGWLAIIDYSPGWAESVPGNEHSAPRSLEDYAAYAAAFAARYGPGGRFWSAHPGLRADPVETIEIWNEPDNPAFWANPNPGLYARVYLAARNAILAVSPSVRVLVGGLWHPSAFLAGMLAARADLAGHIDGVSLHPYGATPFAVLAAVARARGLLRSLGLGAVPLYVTEYGWTTRPPGALDYLPEHLRPGYLEATTAGLGRLGCGLAAVIVYTWATEQRDPGLSEQWFGIHPPQGGTSTDSQAFTAGLRAGAGPPVPCPG